MSSPSVASFWSGKSCVPPPVAKTYMGLCTWYKEISQLWSSPGLPSFLHRNLSKKKHYGLKRGGREAFAVLCKHEFFFFLIVYFQSWQCLNHEKVIFPMSSEIQDVSILSSQRMNGPHFNSFFLAFMHSFIHLNTIHVYCQIIIICQELYPLPTWQRLLRPRPVLKELFV